MPAPAAALPLPLSSQQTLGHPARTVTISARAEGSQVVLSATLGRHTDEATISAAGVQDIVIERAEVAPGHHIAVVRGTGETSFAALVAIRRGAPHILWSSRTDLHGDPGERSAGVLLIDDRTGDGRPDVIVGVRREGAGICGQTETILFPRAYDPRGGQLRPVVLRRLSDGEELEVTATRESPGPTGPPLVRALLPGGASSSSGLAEEDPSATAPPRALFDSDPATFWAEGRGGPGAQEFVTARWNTRFPIRAFAVVLSPSNDLAARLGRPRTFWLIGESGARLRVRVPDDALAQPGARYWVVPPEPLPWRCVTLVLDEAYAPDGTAAAAVHTGIAELEAYTDLDWGGGVEALVQVLVEGGSDGDEAARLLGPLGAPAVSALDAAWERLGEQGRRRAVRVFSRASESGAEEGIGALERAAADPAEPVRVAAVRALGSLGPAAAEVLGRLVAQP
ncbi:MAG TPA: HEAT repeat domain-containing protein, partial [Polyangiaceae bacterium]|nr:HEAT repeat domain-containing protein [Polyangiaceae bacterium]